MIITKIVNGDNGDNDNYDDYNNNSDSNDISNNVNNDKINDDDDDNDDDKNNDNLSSDYIENISCKMTATLFKLSMCYQTYLLCFSPHCTVNICGLLGVGISWVHRGLREWAVRHLCYEHDSPDQYSSKCKDKPSWKRHQTPNSNRYQLTKTTKQSW